MGWQIKGAVEDQMVWAVVWEEEAGEGLYGRKIKARKGLSGRFRGGGYLKECLCGRFKRPGMPRVVHVKRNKVITIVTIGNVVVVCNR